MTNPLSTATPRRLKELIPAEVGATLAADPRLIIPVGTCEQHGPHLPLGCKTIIVDRLADDLSAEFSVLRAPTLEYGVNAATERSHVGNASLRKKTLHRMLNDLIDTWECNGVQEFVLLTAHGYDLHQEAMGTVITKQARVRVVDIFAVHIADLLESPDLPIHGGEVDTSVMLHLAPELVHMESVADYMIDRPSRRLHRARLRVPGESPGSLGQPSLATAEKGRAIYERIRNRVSERIFRAPPPDDP